MDTAHARLDGKVAVVTGGTQGLGEAIARLFAKRGAAGIVICGRNAERGAMVTAEFAKTGCRANLGWMASRARTASCATMMARRMVGSRRPRPNEAARAVAFLASEESGMLTGVTVDYNQTSAGCWEQAPHPTFPA